VRSDYYRLSHGLEFGYAAAMFNLPYQQVDNLADFQASYHEALDAQGATVIEVNVSQHQASDQIAAISLWVKQS
ncbi:MAG: 2-succinyl-5-enolpyruvyl-6-hydroxy-3-cyclohexene-1-carboxylic-acid synthase, partial [Shewanella sp.]